MANGPRPERSLGELFQELSQDTSALIRQEMALARAEMSERVSAFARDAAMMAVGGVLVLLALFALTATLILGLIALGLDGWLAALIVTVVYAAAGGAIIMSGRAAMKRRSLTPVETVDSIKETAQWLKNQTR
jgi:hypothetical protein